MRWCAVNMAVVTDIIYSYLKIKGAVVNPITFIHHAVNLLLTSPYMYHTYVDVALINKSGCHYHLICVRDLCDIN